VNWIYVNVIFHKLIIALIKYLGNLYHLRYLGIRNTSISHLPEEIGNLQFLQTLDVRHNPISRLPWSVVQLRNMMCLYIDNSARVPNGIGNLTCLEQLSWLYIDGSTLNIIEELGQLTELRQLCIKLDKWNDKLLECLRKLQKIHELDILAPFGPHNIIGLDAWVAPHHLRLLSALCSCCFLHYQLR
jgi:Leucine-rich repeat (LRR) protein